MKMFRRCVMVGLAAGGVAVLAACGSSSGGGASTGGKPGSPITIGTSLSLSGDFAADGQAFEKGYQLWVHDQNAKGGLLGHPIQLKVVSDASSPAQVVTNYQKLIGSDKVPLVFGPFSTHALGPRVRLTLLDAADRAIRPGGGSIWIRVPGGRGRRADGVHAGTAQRL